MLTLETVRSALESEGSQYQELAGHLGIEAIDHLVTLASDGDSLVAAKALYVASYLGAKIHGDQVTRLLLDAGRSPDSSVRIAAAGACRNLQPASCAEVVLDLLDDPDRGVLKVALNSVPAVSYPEIRSKVDVLSRDVDPRIRRLASKVLEKLPRVISAHRAEAC